jgi:hypothetical protein
MCQVVYCQAQQPFLENASRLVSRVSHGGARLIGPVLHDRLAQRLFVVEIVTHVTRKHRLGISTLIRQQVCW